MAAGRMSRLKECYRVRNDRHSDAAGGVSPRTRPIRCGKKIGCSHSLRRQNAIHRFERELAPPMQKIGDMRLRKAGLPRK